MTVIDPCVCGHSSLAHDLRDDKCKGKIRSNDGWKKCSCRFYKQGVSQL